MTLGNGDSGLVGRAGELGAIDAAIADAVAGSAPVLALVGEAGIGKSALLAATRERAAGAGLTVLEGRAAEHERDVPFGLVTDALDDTVAALHDRRLESLGPERLADLAGVLPAAAQHAESPAPAAGPAERFRYHRALVALLGLLARERPVALLLDDLHWADEGSVEFVLHLLRRPADGVLLVFASRPVDPAPRLLDALRGAPGATLLRLEPLSRDAALALLAGVGDDALRSRLEQEAGGNPLFLQELARVAPKPGEPLPSTLLAAVQLEVAALPPASRALIEGAAVAGDPFDLDLAVAAADLDPDDALVPLDRLVAADLVRAGDGRRFRFRHPLIRRAVYDTAPAGWRLGAHERIADALADRGASATARAFHVEHYARPGDRAALQVLADAAGESFDTAPAAAARWYDAALALVPETDHEQRVGLLAPRALALASAGQFEASRAALLQSLDLLGDEAPLDLRLLLVAGCSEVEQVLGRHQEARARLLEAYEALPERAPLRARLEVQLATVAAFTLDHDELSAWAEQAVLRLGDERSALALGASAIASFAAAWRGHPERALEAVAHAERLLDQVDDGELAAYPEAPFMLSSAQLFLGRFSASAAAAERGIAVSRAFRQDRMLVPLHIFAAMARWNRVELDAALVHLDAAEEGARLQNVGYLLGWTLWMRVMTQRVRGDLADVARVAPEARALTQGLEPSITPSSGLCNLAVFDPAVSPERRLQEVVAAGGGEDLPRVDPIWATALMRDLCRAALEAGRPEVARAWADRAQALAERLDHPLSSLRAAGSRVEVLSADGDDAAAELALRVVEDALAADAPLEALLARVPAGRALAASGRREEAIEMLQAAVEAAGATGAGMVRDAAAQELRRLGSRPSAAASRAGTGTGLDTLTEREREIAELVAQGLANKAVAASMFLSVKTIEHNLSRIYAKAGVRSRTELAALIGGDGAP